MVTLNLDSKLYDIVEEKDHPTDDPDFPSYRCEEYRELSKEWEFIDDMVEGRSKWVTPASRKLNRDKLYRYLPSYEGEHSTDYRIRYTHTPWYGLFKESLKKLPGYLSQVSYTDFINPDLRKHWGNCDKQNTSIPTFFLDADYRVLKDQVCFILVDYPDFTDAITSPNQLLQFEARPFLKLIERKDLINFIHDEYNKLTKIVIKETVSLPISAYGKDYYTQYREFNQDGSYRISVIVKEAKKNGVVLKNTKQNYLVYTVKEGRNSIGEIPLVVYSYDRMHPFIASCIFYNLAELQLNHYELCSQDYTSLRQTNFPIYVRKGVKRVGEKSLESSNEAPKILAPNRMQDLPQDGDFSCVSPPSTWAEINENRLKRIEEEFEKQTNNFLGQSQPAKTATQTMIEASGRNADIVTLALRKLQALNNIEYFWAKYYNQTVDLSEDSSNFRIDLSALGFANQETTDKPSTIASEDTTSIIGEAQ